MLFNSYVFLFIFLPITWVAFRLAGRLRLGAAPMIVLVAASLVFYAYWDVRFVRLLVLSATFNCSWASLLDRPRIHTKFLLALGIGIHLAVLGYFKYTNFLLENLTQAGVIPPMQRDIILPLGISFFTFVQIAYLVDRYTGDARPGGPLDYATFVTFFPQLIALGGRGVRHDRQADLPGGVGPQPDLRPVALL
jgi:alginate O-acetyltransferase complex protein AlgI